MITEKPKALHLLGAAEAAEAVRSGQISAEELALACVRRIEETEPRLKAWTFFDKEILLKHAREYDQKRADGRTPGHLLGGVPVGIKDIFNTEDMPTQMGSPIWKDFMPGNDARAVFNLKRQGGIVAGKTVTAEFAVHAPGPTVNPHHPGRITGTSSSGSAVAVAADMVPCSLGTQTAGSIIRPASYCGVYGFKPTYGLIPRTGVLKTTDTLDTIGFFGKSVEDLEILLESLRVQGADYPVSHRHLEDSRRQEKSGKKWKVAVMRTPTWKYVEPYAQEALFKFAEDLAKREEFEITQTELPSVFGEAHDAHEKIYDKMLSHYFEGEFKQKTLISKEIKEMIDRGNCLTLADYQEACARQVELTHLLDQFFENYDIILTLSTAGEAPELGNPEKPDSCLIWTLCGAPAISLPVLRGSEGLPYGIQIVARKYADKKLLHFAKLITSRR